LNVDPRPRGQRAKYSLEYRRVLPAQVRLV
jgi:hypothetical protein